MENVYYKKSSQILDECIKLQDDRGNDYDTQGGHQERSFGSISKAFNTITGKGITPAEVCLMLQILKDVRQWSQDRLHEDSVLDGVSYASLKAEELFKQYNE